MRPVFLACALLGSLWGGLVSAAEPSVEKLGAALSAATPEEQYAAADQLAELGIAADAAVPQLVAALESKDAQLRWRAARALGLIGNAKAIDSLRKHAADEDSAVRAQAIFALGRLKTQDKASLTAIVGRITDTDVQVRRAAYRALLMIKADRSIIRPLIIKSLEDADPAVVVPALHTLAEAGEEVVPALADALDHAEARYWACLVLAEIGPKAKEAAPALGKVLTDPRPEVRLQAAMALAEIGPDAKAAVPDLIKAAGDVKDDSFRSVQYAAVAALGRIGDKSAAPVIEKALQSDDAFLRIVGAWASAKIEPENKEKLAAAVRLLVVGLTDEHPNHRRAAARGLMELEAPELVSKEIDLAMVNLKPEQIDRMMEAFAALGPRAVPRATQLLSDPMRRERALRILGMIGAESAPAVPELIKLLKDADPKVQNETLFVLAAIGPKADAAVGPVTELLATADRDVRLTANYALGRLGPAAKSAVPELKKELASDDQMTKVTAVWALLKIEPQDKEIAATAVPLLTGALSHPYEFIRVEAAMALGELGPQAAAAAPALEKTSLTDSSEQVRAVALHALEKIKGKN
jgi:HEAT repeat protein